MHVDITLKNYRCFPDTKPAFISVRNGLTAFVGVNNSGKSTLLRFFYEFRGLFQALQNPNGLGPALQHSAMTFTPADSVLDINEVFSNSNNRDLEIEFRLSLTDDSAGNMPFAKRLAVTVPRGTNTWLANLYPDDTTSSPYDLQRI